MDDIRFQLLGPMEILVDGAPAKLPGVAERALLAQLLLAPGRTIPATLLVDRLWSEATLPVDPMNALQIRVSKLRRALRGMGVDELVTRDGVGYRAGVEPAQSTPSTLPTGSGRRRADTTRAAADGEYDQRHLQAYDDALGLWGGEPLSDFAPSSGRPRRPPGWWNCAWPLSSSAPRWPWRSGLHLEVVGDLEPLVSADPTVESLAGLLMLGFVPQRTPGRRTGGLHPHPSRARRDARPGAVGLAPLVARAGAAAGRVAGWRLGRGRGERGRRSPQSRRRGRSRQLTNLPTVLRPLIGRDEQLDSLSTMLGGVTAPVPDRPRWGRQDFPGTRDRGSGLPLLP